ncbi:hypothetical protein ACF06V_02230 [Streptomyces bobili]|uniref:hypothetical protein n=1 Tax=Streptomyces bobili TaxID=67280 RepID=UPI0036F93377
MKWQQVQDCADAAYVVVLDPGEEAVAALTGFARDAKDYGGPRSTSRARCSRCSGTSPVGEEGPTSHPHAVPALINLPHGAAPGSDS